MADPVDVFLAVAAAEVGTRETPPGSNRTPYGAWAVQQGRGTWLATAPWCDVFVSYCADRAGLGDVIPFSAYVPARLAAARALGQADRAPRRGDLACFDWDHDGIPDHIGIVEAVNPAGTLTTIEGNTSGSDVGSQSNGDGVYRRVRRMPNVLSVIHPPYEEATMPLTQADLNAIAAIVWNARINGDNAAGSVSAGTKLDRAYRASQTGSPVTLSQDQVNALAAATAALTGAGTPTPDQLHVVVLGAVQSALNSTHLTTT